MKNKIQKLVLITLTMTGLLSQIGCSPYGTIEVCNPDRLEGIDGVVERKYNGSVTGLQDSFGFNFDVDSITIKNGSVKTIDQARISPRETDYDRQVVLENFPINENQTKDFSLRMKIKADYYSVKNISTGHVQSLVPLSDTYSYQGWYDNTSALLQYGFYDNGYEIDNEVDQILLRVTDIANASFTLEPHTAMQRSKVTTFPDVSPLGDLQIELEKEKIWTGQTTVKVLKNSGSVFKIQATTTVTDGINTFEQTDLDTYSIQVAECHDETDY